MAVGKNIPTAIQMYGKYTSKICIKSAVSTSKDFKLGMMIIWTIGIVKKKKKKFRFHSNTF